MNIEIVLMDRYRLSGNTISDAQVFHHAGMLKGVFAAYEIAEKKKESLNPPPYLNLLLAAGDALSITSANLAVSEFKGPIQEIILSSEQPDLPYALSGQGYRQDKRLIVSAIRGGQDSTRIWKTLLAYHALEDMSMALFLLLSGVTDANRVGFKPQFSTYLSTLTYLRSILSYSSMPEHQLIVGRNNRTLGRLINAFEHAEADPDEEDYWKATGMTAYSGLVTEMAEIYFQSLIHVALKQHPSVDSEELQRTIHPGLKLGLVEGLMKSDNNIPTLFRKMEEMGMSGVSAAVSSLRAEDMIIEGVPKSALRLFLQGENYRQQLIDLGADTESIDPRDYLHELILRKANVSPEQLLDPNTYRQAVDILRFRVFLPENIYREVCQIIAQAQPTYDPISVQGNEIPHAYYFRGDTRSPVPLARIDEPYTEVISAFKQKIFAVVSLIFPYEGFNTEVQFFPRTLLSSVHAQRGQYIDRRHTGHLV